MIIMINRIALIGISGSGKTTLARKLSKKFDLSVFHADALEWLPNWVEQEPAFVISENQKLVSQEKWIIEGWIDVAKVDRLNAADLVIDLDYSGILCGIRTLRRMIGKGKRQELPEGCIDRWSWKFLWTVLTKKERSHIDATIRQAHIKAYHRFKSSRQFEVWLKV